MKRSIEHILDRTKWTRNGKMSHACSKSVRLSGEHPSNSDPISMHLYRRVAKKIPLFERTPILRNLAIEEMSFTPRIQNFYG